jgi:hypothetical protein
MTVASRGFIRRACPPAQPSARRRAPLTALPTDERLTRAPLACNGGRGGAGAIALWTLNVTLAGLALRSLAISQVLAVEFSAAFLMLSVTRLARGSGRSKLRPAEVALGAVGVAGTIGLQYLALSRRRRRSLPTPSRTPGRCSPLPSHHPAQGGEPCRSPPRVRRLRRESFCSFAAKGGGRAGTRSRWATSPPWGPALEMAVYTLRAGKTRVDTTDLLRTGTGAAHCSRGRSRGRPQTGGGRRPSSPWPPASGSRCSLWATGRGRWHCEPRSAHDLAPAAYLTPLFSTLVLLMTGHSIDALGLVGCTPHHRLGHRADRAAPPGHRAPRPARAVPDPPRLNNGLRGGWWWIQPMGGGRPGRCLLPGRASARVGAWP